MPQGALEPSDALIYKSNRLRFVPWEKYTAKDSELEKECKPEHMFSLDSSGKLKIESKKTDVAADTSTEILLQFALQRRGLSSAGVQVTAEGRPLDKHFVECMNRSEVVHLLQPLPSKQSESVLPDKVFVERPSPYRKGKGKDKTKAKGKDTSKMPLTLVQSGCRARTNAGDPICFGFNLGTCSLPVNRGRCDRGFHVSPSVASTTLSHSVPRRRTVDLD